MIIEMLRMIWFSICWIWCIPRCLKLIKLISENLSNKPTTGQPSNLIIDIDLKWFGKLRLWVCGQKWFELLLRKFPCLGFWLTAYLSESHYGRCYDQVGERRRASPDFIGTLSRNPHSFSLSLLTPRANHDCGSDTAPEIEASGLFVHRSTESCRGGGGKAQQSRWTLVAPRVELFPSL